MAKSFGKVQLAALQVLASEGKVWTDGGFNANTPPCKMFYGAYPTSEDRTISWASMNALEEAGLVTYRSLPRSFQAEFVITEAGVAYLVAARAEAFRKWNRAQIALQQLGGEPSVAK